MSVVTIKNDMREKAFRICRDYLNGIWKFIAPQEMVLKQVRSVHFHTKFTWLHCNELPHYADRARKESVDVWATLSIFQLFLLIRSFICLPPGSSTSCLVLTQFAILLMILDAILATVCGFLSRFFFLFVILNFVSWILWRCLSFIC